MGLDDGKISECPVTVIASVPDSLGAQPPAYDPDSGAHPFTKKFLEELRFCLATTGSKCTPKSVLETAVKDKGYFVNSKNYIHETFGENYQPVGEDAGAESANINKANVVVTQEMVAAGGGAGPEVPGGSFKQILPSKSNAAANTVSSDDMMQMSDRPTNIYEARLAAAKAKWEAAHAHSHKGSEFAFRSLEMMQTYAVENGTAGYNTAAGYPQVNDAIKAHHCEAITNVGWTEPLVIGNPELDLGALASTV